ncbi:hypothetical protein D4764_08G0008320 [Takifugu flavidus]|uniref:Integrase p58-like C-terminal domain-containing protein n=1 Tax=Takifugu flavidus TaxID=433684 RepID=A0A5C6MQ23_9TELE|nr:hypothetical protein D4764_08G0008320 [Takifugu flavidus]
MRMFSPGDRVLALLPIPGSPFEARFSGPYTIKRKTSDTDYLLATPDRRRSTQLCHVNLLKPYYDRGWEKAVALAAEGVPSLQVADEDDVVAPDEAVLLGRAPWMWASVFWGGGVTALSCLTVVGAGWKSNSLADLQGECQAFPVDPACSPAHLWPICWDWLPDGTRYKTCLESVEEGPLSSYLVCCSGVRQMSPELVRAAVKVFGAYGHQLFLRCLMESKVRIPVVKTEIRNVCAQTLSKELVSRSTLSSREQDPRIHELLHLRQNFSTNLEWAKHPFPVENHGLGFGGANFHPSCFTLGSQLHQYILEVLV